MFMMTTGILVFSIVSTILSFLVIRKFERFEKAELISYVMLIVWGAFLFGIYIARSADKVLVAGIFR